MRPTENGWYWFRWDETCDWIPVEAWKPKGCRSMYMKLQNEPAERIGNRGEWGPRLVPPPPGAKWGQVLPA